MTQQPLSKPSPESQSAAKQPKPVEKQGYYHNLNLDLILDTTQQLKNRIEERFPHAGLAQVCEELLKISRDARQTTLAIARPMWGLRIFIYLVIVASIALAAILVKESRWTWGNLELADIITLADSLFNVLILIGAAVLFLFTVEVRVKRRRALTAIHRLRSLAHIIDMHQLTKDPEKVMGEPTTKDTASSPKRLYTRFELGRYLDYSSEMLSLIGKVGAIYIERFPDGEAVSSVNELESLTTGLSRKIWQKIMILDSGVAEKS